MEQGISQSSPAADWRKKDYITNDVMRAFGWVWETGDNNAQGHWRKGDSVVSQKEAYQLVDYKILNARLPLLAVWYRFKRFITKKYYIRFVAEGED